MAYLDPRDDKWGLEDAYVAAERRLLQAYSALKDMSVVGLF